LATEPEALRCETLRIRQLLEREKGGRHSENDLKYGPGGMLDVYFATRYLQLRHDLPEDREDRSTSFTLQLLWEKGLLTESDYESFASGYAFISELDHNVRLVTGRSRRLPSSSESVEIIARRMNIADTKTLLEQLAVHRLNIRLTFEKALSP
jgi:glutamate-ammonia-ligase adenylyltransferase